MAQPCPRPFHVPPARVAPQLAPLLPGRRHPVTALRAKQRTAPLRQARPRRARSAGSIIAHARRLRARPPGALARDGHGGQRSVPAGSLLPGTPSPRGFPKASLGRRPPPSAADPCHVWSSRRRLPFVRGGNAAVSTRLSPVALAWGIQGRQGHAPRLPPHALGSPIPAAPPARARGRRARRQDVPARAAPEAPQDAFASGPSREGLRAPTWRSLERREQGRHLCPLRLRECWLCASHRQDSFRRV
jgi:hypothetical protein